MSTYKDFLEMLGISHAVFMIILIILFLISSFFVMLWKMGIFTKIKFKQTTFPKSEVIYAKFEGKYDIINTKMQQVLQDTKQFFKLSDLFGIYYDPLEEQQPENMEAAIGVMVKDIQKIKGEQFLRKMGNKYKKSSLPTTICVGTRYPYFNSSSLIMIVNRVYPRLAEFVRVKKLNVGPGVIEVYHLLSSSPYVQILVPTENHQNFILP